MSPSKHIYRLLFTLPYEWGFRLGLWLCRLRMLDDGRLVDR